VLANPNRGRVGWGKMMFVGLRLDGFDVAGPGGV
jgi:hypothetical protein